MMNLWKKATGKIKDRNTIWLTALSSRKSRHRQPDLEGAIIKATSHDDSNVDYKNAQRVFTWVRTSPSHLIVFLWALTRRTQRTQNWVVALKSLILLHGVLCTKAPGTRKIGRLPFDLSDFEDGSTSYGLRRRGRSQFVRAYFAFCDLKSVILSAELKDEMVDEGEVAGAVLARVVRWQELLDAVMEVRCKGDGIKHDVAVLEAMDCMVIEVFELYSKICDGIAKGLMLVYKEKVGKVEASMALDILHKATTQGRDLSEYFHFCTEIGILDLTECPKIQQIPEEDFSELKKIINGDKGESINKDDMEGKHKPWLKTVITDKWEVFEEDIIEDGRGNENEGIAKDPFEASINFPPANPFIDYGGTPSSQLVISLL